MAELTEAEIRGLLELESKVKDWFTHTDDCGELYIGNSAGFPILLPETEKDQDSAMLALQSRNALRSLCEEVLRRREEEAKVRAEERESIIRMIQENCRNESLSNQLAKLIRGRTDT
jgi:hypothetical protein